MEKETNFNTDNVIGFRALLETATDECLKDILQAAKDELKARLKCNK